MTEDIFEQAKLFLPKYLTPAQVKELYSELQKFPDNFNYYLNSLIEDKYLQGDGWSGFLAVNFTTLERKQVSGVILSNSCDIDPANPTSRDRSILFSPLIPLRSYRALLERSGKNPAQIEQIETAISKQEITYIFYLPKYKEILDESIIILDDIHQHKLSDFQRREASKIFALNQYAFYLFLIKLSIHFSRFNEGLRRFD